MHLIRKTALRYALAVLLQAPASLTAQNLIVNGDFDTDLVGWQFPDATPTWSPLDAGNALQSGSARGVNMDTGRVCVMRQCVAVPRSGRQILSVWTFTPPDQGFGNLILSYTARHHSPTCTGGSFASGGTYLPSVDSWTHHALSFVIEANPPPPDTTVEVHLCIDPARQIGFHGHFDRVRLDPDLIFRDGME